MTAAAFISGTAAVQNFSWGSWQWPSPVPAHSPGAVLLILGNFVVLGDICHLVGRSQGCCRTFYTEMSAVRRWGSPPQSSVSQLGPSQEVASFGRALWAGKAWDYPLCRDLLTCCLFTLRTGSVCGLSPTQTALWPPVLGLTVAPRRSTNHS